MTRRSPLLMPAFLMAAALLLPSSASAQHHGPRVSAHAAVVVGTPYYYQPFWYNPWYPYWYPSPYYYGAGYYDNSSSLRLQVTPRQAEVFIDGNFAGVVDDFDGTFQRLQLEPGEHELQLFLPGYRAISQRIYLQPRSTFRVKHALEPLAAGDPEPVRPVGAPRGQGISGSLQGPRPPAAPRAAAAGDADYGTLAVRVQPADAEVIIDGEKWDSSGGDDRLVVQLAPGPHRIEVRKEGYLPFSSDVNVRPGDTAPLNVSLARPR